MCMCLADANSVAKGTTDTCLEDQTIDALSLVEAAMACEETQLE